MVSRQQNDVHLSPAQFDFLCRFETTIFVLQKVIMKVGRAISVVVLVHSGLEERGKHYPDCVPHNAFDPQDGFLSSLQQQHPLLLHQKVIHSIYVCMRTDICH